MKPNLRSAPYQNFLSRWEQRKQEAAQVFMHERVAHVIGVLLQDLEDVRLEEVSDEVGVQEAAAVSGYSESSIWRLLDDEKVPNVGEPGRPRIRIRDMPFKPRVGDATSEKGVLSETKPGSNIPAIGTAKLETIKE